MDSQSKLDHNQALSEYPGLLKLAADQIVPLTQEQSVLYMSMLTHTVQADFNGQDAPFAYQLVAGRLKAQGVDGVDPTLAMWCAYLSRNPGICVMWAYTIHLMTKEKKRTVVMHDFADFFPDGLPSPAAYEKRWDAQKVGGANLLDMGAWL